jgi:hypothetical protein
MQKLSTLAGDIERQTTGIESFKQQVRKEVKNAEVAARLVHLLTRAYGRDQSNGLVLQQNVYMPSQYDWEKLAEFTQRMEELRSQIEEVDRYLITTIHHENKSNPQYIQNILRMEHDAMVAVAAKVAQYHNMVDDLRERYRTFRVKYLNDPKDPFEEDDHRASLLEAPPLHAQLLQVQLNKSDGKNNSGQNQNGNNNGTNNTGTNNNGTNSGGWGTTSSTSSSGNNSSSTGGWGSTSSGNNNSSSSSNSSSGGWGSTSSSGNNTSSSSGSGWGSTSSGSSGNNSSSSSGWSW